MRPKKIISLTGDRPTGRLHLGHFLGSIQNRIKLQDEADESFYMIADMQALTDNADNPQKVRENVFEVALDNLACGLDPQKTTLFIQSQVPEISELALLFLNLVTISRLKRNPTVKAEMKQKGYGEDVPVGFLSYPVSQAADILFVKANTVPVGEDQLPVLEQANEIIQKFNNIYGSVFEKINPVISENPRIIGIDGKAKMSKSLGNAIYLSDTEKEIKQKVMSMYTDPGHTHIKDPGKVKGNVVFAYLDIFDPNKNEVENLKKRYEKGGLGDVEIKKRLESILQAVIAPIREKREKLAQDRDYVMSVLEKGTSKAREVAALNLNEIKTAMKINYFN